LKYKLLGIFCQDKNWIILRFQSGTAFDFILKGKNIYHIFIHH